MCRPEGQGGAQPGARSKGGSLPPPPAPRAQKKKCKTLQWRREKPTQKSQAYGECSAFISYVFFIIIIIIISVFPVCVCVCVCDIYIYIYIYRTYIYIYFFFLLHVFFFRPNKFKSHKI